MQRLLLALCLLLSQASLAADIAVELVSNPTDGFVAVGEQASVTMRITNLGPDAMPLALIRSNEVNGPSFPATTQQCFIVVGQVNPPISNISYIFNWTISNIAPATTVECEVRFTVLRLPNGRIPITIQLSPATPDDNPANNSASVLFRERGTAAIPVPMTSRNALLSLIVALLALGTYQSRYRRRQL
jgi:hypothetical protein